MEWILSIGIYVWIKLTIKIGFPNTLESIMHIFSDNLVAKKYMFLLINKL